MELRALMLAPPSPLWGGNEGGGIEADIRRQYRPTFLSKI